MKRYRKTAALLAALVMVSAVFTGCSQNRNTSKETEIPSDINVSNISEQNIGDIADVKCTIMLSDSGISCSGNGAAADGNTLKITEAGDYLISGELSDGRICIEADESSQVRLIMNGVSVSSSVSSAISAENGAAVTLLLAEGTENSFTDTSEYSADDKCDACIYAKGSLTISGAGSVNVTGNANHGIHSKGILSIDSGNISVTSANDGIKGKDAVNITDGAISVTSAGDAVCANNSDDGMGTVDISGGEFTIVTGGGAANAPVKRNEPFGRNDASDEDGVSSKGIKSQGSLTISGGKFNMDCCDDSFHSNSDLTVSGGEFTIATGDDAFHADSALVMDSGKGEISKCYEGFEGMTVTVNGGEWSITASDDGINAADGSSSGGQPFVANENTYIEINGGTLYVSADGDGIDSNGDITINDGNISVDGPTTGADSALDFDGTGIVNGGTLYAAGSSAMAQIPSDSSEQYTLALFFTSAREGGTKIALKRSDGTEIFSCTPSKSFETLVISAAELAENSEITVFENDTELCTVTLSGKVTKINESGESVSGGFGGFGGEKPQRPDGEAPEMPQPPDGFENGEMPQPPDGFGNGEMPQMPEGGFGNGERPEVPNGERPDGTPPRADSETSASA